MQDSSNFKFFIPIAGDASSILMPSTRRGGCRIKKMSRSYLGAADGVVGNADLFGTSNHPVRSVEEASRHFS